MADNIFIPMTRSRCKVNKPVNYELGAAAITQPEKIYYENNRVVYTSNYY